MRGFGAQCLALCPGGKQTGNVSGRKKGSGTCILRIDDGMFEEKCSRPMSRTARVASAQHACALMYAHFSRVHVVLHRNAISIDVPIRIVEFYRLVLSYREDSSS